MNAMSQFLKQAMSDNRTGLASVKRVGILVATIAMSVALLILAASTLLGHDTAMAITGVAASLSALAGGSYVGGIHADAKRELKDGA